MYVNYLNNECEISYLDKVSHQYVLHNFGADSENVWGIWDNHGNIMGYCTLGYAEGVISDVNDVDLLLADVFILPKYRNKGYATILITEALYSVHTPVYAQILNEDLISFYSRFGFEEVEYGLLLRK